MIGRRRSIRGILASTAVILMASLGAEDPHLPKQPLEQSSPRKSSVASKSRFQEPDSGIPECPWHGGQVRGKAAPIRKKPARAVPVMPGTFPPGQGIPGIPSGMPEMFARMGEAFARDPATGFQTFIQGLGDMEGPALESVTLTPAEERQAGRKARDEYMRRAAQQGYGESRDREKLAKVRRLVDQFAARMKHRDRYPKIEVSLIDAPISDGQSFPGGYLIFTTALVDEPDENTLAGVVAHELAHLDLGHLYGYARRSKLAEATYSRPPGGGANFDQFFTRQMALLGLLMNPYRPEHELEADCTSVTWLHQEGMDGAGLVGFFERLHERIQDQPANPFFSFGRSHPSSLERKNHVQRRMAQLNAARDLEK
ncbi:MAG: M48 family metalloprotease [Isosphaeraceae bacterium]